MKEWFHLILMCFTAVALLSLVWISSNGMDYHAIDYKVKEKEQNIIQMDSVTPEVFYNKKRQELLDEKNKLEDNLRKRRDTYSYKAGKKLEEFIKETLVAWNENQGVKGAAQK